MEAKTKYHWRFEVEYIDAHLWICRGHHPGLYDTLADARKAIRAERSGYARMIRMVRVTHTDIMQAKEEACEAIA